MNGHLLEEAVCRAFPHLRRFNNPGDLLRHLIDPVSVEVPQIVPQILLETLRRLLDEPI